MEPKALGMGRPVKYRSSRVMRYRIGLPKRPAAEIHVQALALPVGVDGGGACCREITIRNGDSRHVVRTWGEGALFSFSTHLREELGSSRAEKLYSTVQM